MRSSRRTFLAQATSALALGGIGSGCTRKDTTMTATPEVSFRSVSQVLPGMATSDGAGVKLTRVIGQPRLRNLDPFLMLDRFHSDDPDAYIAGFPDHPHRGFETVTVMLDGRMRHKDSRGNHGLIHGGGIQWMTAGRGIVHSEMPEQESGLMSGFQLWVNLPKDQKMAEPFYQDLQPEKIAVADLDGKGKARVVSGDLFGQKGPVRARPSEPLLAHVALQPGHTVEVPLPTGHTSFVFVNEGDISIAEKKIARAELAILNKGERVKLTAGEKGAQLLFAAGKPFGEPIVQYGPFVMNTQEEIERAFYDYKRGTLGHD